MGATTRATARRQRLWNTIVVIVLSLAFGSFTSTATAAVTNGTGAKPKQPRDEEAVGKIFSEIGYRPHSLVRYVARTHAWKEGRRDVLDWGSGGGGLSRALARQGAHKVIALDMNPHATRAAQRNLKPFPTAVARGGAFRNLWSSGTTSHFFFQV